MLIEKETEGDRNRVHIFSYDPRILTRVEVNNFFQKGFSRDNLTNVKHQSNNN